MTPKLEEFLAMLRRLEWSEAEMGGPVCPECGFIENGDGHAKDCDLAAWLSVIESWVADPFALARYAMEREAEYAAAYARERANDATEGE